MQPLRLLLFMAAAKTTAAAVVTLDVFYPEELIALNRSALPGYEDVVFTVGFSTAPYWYDGIAEHAPYFTNYTYLINNETDRVGLNHWRKAFDVGDEVGPVYFQLIEDQLRYRSMLMCDDAVLRYPGYCMPRHSPYRVYVNEPSEELSLTLYPFFDVAGKGFTEALLPSFYSEQLGNARDINVYTPYSLVENNILRPVNVLVVHDGSLDTVRLFAESGGVDHMEGSGVLPELIIIGIPNAPNGSACPDTLGSNCSQRTYELTPTDCKEGLNYCLEQQSYGGTGLYLDFIYDDVIPAVLGALGGFQLGEVSNLGFSFGGMTACWAASTRPTQFERGICMSPSVWWNYGEMSDVVRENYEESQVLPKSITVSIGSQEGFSLVQTGPDVPPAAWDVFVQDMVDTFESIGLGSKTASSAMHPDGSLYPSYSSNLGYFIYEGGMHNMVNQLDVLSYVLPLAFSSEYPSATGSEQPQRNSLMTVRYPLESSCDSDSADDQYTLVVGLIVALCAVSLCCVAMALYVLLLLRKVQDPSLMKHHDELSSKL